MKTAFVTSSVSRNAGGLLTSVRGLAQALHESQGVEIHILASEDEHSKHDIPTWAPLVPWVFTSYAPRSFSYAPGLACKLRRLDLNLLHTHGLWTYKSVATLNWARHRRKPYLVAPHGMLDLWALRNSRWKKRLAGWLYENAHLCSAGCLHALCEYEAQSIRSYGLQNPICVIPNGVDLLEALELNRPPSDYTVQNGLKVLLYLGRLHPKKGLRNLVRAWGLIRHHATSSSNEWRLIIAGWDQDGHEEELKELCRQIGIQDNVSFAGPKFDVEKHATYYDADAFILPSFSEGLPMGVLEAWSYGLPVLMTPQCNLPEGFKVGAAVQVDTTDQSIARGLDVLLSMSDQERWAMGMNGRQLVENQFSWNKIAADMRTVYDWLLGGGPKPTCVITD